MSRVEYTIGGELVDPENDLPISSYGAFTIIRELEEKNEKLMNKIQSMELPKVTDNFQCMECGSEFTNSTNVNLHRKIEKLEKQLSRSEFTLEIIYEYNKNKIFTSPDCSYNWETVNNYFENKEKINE